MANIGVKTMSRRTYRMRASKGISLVEMTISIFIVSIAVMGADSLFIAVTNTSAGNSEMVQVQQEARYAMEKMARELRESSADRVWTGTDLSSSESMVVFLTPRNGEKTFAVDESGGPEWRKAVLYRLDILSSSLHRYQSTEPDMLSALAAEDVDTYSVDKVVYAIQSREHAEVLGGNSVVGIAALSFTRTDDKLVISMRAGAKVEGVEGGGGRGNVAAPFAHLHTMVRLRN